MKLAFPALALLFLLGPGRSVSQETQLPPNPIIGTDSVGGGSSTSTRGGVSIRRQPAPPPKRISFVVVSPVREWVDVDQRRIRASLVAFDDGKPAGGGSATSDGGGDGAGGEKAPRVLVRDGKVRLWVEGSKKLSEFPLARLSEEDQLYVRRMVEAAGKTGRPATDPDPQGDGGD